MPFRARKTIKATTSVLLALILLPGCVSLSPDWQLRQQRLDINYFTRQSSVKGLPDFKASVRLNAPMAKVMEVLTDFDRQPDWVYRCRRVSVIALKGFDEAYLYQVNDIPIFKDRDLILHARIATSDDGTQTRISLDAEPDYCRNKNDAECDDINQSNDVRITRAHGEFIITRFDAQTTHIEWQQFLDPGGALPHWLFSLALSRVPIQSFDKLKTLIETQ